MVTKVCKRCNLEKDILDFRHQTRNDKIYISGVCKKCDSKNGRKHWNKFAATHRAEINEKNREYYDENKVEIKERQKDRKKIWDRNYYLKNKKKIQQIQGRRVKERYKADPNFRIRKSISKGISRSLRLSGHSKNGQSCLNFLSYTIRELREHLERQFEPWMTWKNYGIYDGKLWDDDNSNTWTWQIDHIIPQSDLPYNNMENDNFKKCWSLSNLRPLSAKINNSDGTSRIRHKGNK